jgi:hypothetical protein
VAAGSDHVVNINHREDLVGERQRNPLQIRET